MWVYNLADFGHELRCLWPVVKSYTRWCLLFTLEMLVQDEVVDRNHLSQRQVSIKGSAERISFLPEIRLML